MIQKILAFIMLTVFSMMCFGKTDNRKLELIRDGKSNAAIILSKRPTKAAQLGAMELQHFLRKISGAEVPIRQDAVRGIINIHVGDSPAVRQAGLNPKTLIGESYWVKTDGNNIYLIGNDTPDFGKVDYFNLHTFPRHYFQTRGTLHAVYDFLEEQCGVTFCGPWENSIAYPETGNVAVSPVNRKFTPQLDAFRIVCPDDYAYTPYPIAAREHALWHLRWRLVNNYGEATHNIYSIYYRYWGKAKSPYLAGEFKTKRPELFASGYQGTSSYIDAVVRNQYPDDADLPPSLCFTNPDTARYYAQEAATYYNGKNVRGGWGNVRGTISPEKCLTPRIPGNPFFYPVEPADSNLFCKCSKCRNLYSELKGDLKTSHVKFHFIAEIAKAAASINPAIGISTLSYIQTLPYPYKVKLPPNVSVELCLTQFAWWHPGIRKAQEREYELWIKNEAKKRPITLWTYIFTPHWDSRLHFHYNNFPGLYPWKTGEMMKRFTRDGIKGWFTEVELHQSLLEAYVAARIAFDPSLDVNAVVDRWFQASFGKAAPAMKQIYKISEDAWWNYKNYPAKWFADPNQPYGPRGPHNPYWGTALHSETVNWTIGSPERMAKIEKLLAEAAKLVEKPSEKAALNRFMQAIWEPARRGRIQYDLKLANMGKRTQKKLVPSLIRSAQGDPRKVDWSGISSTGNWVQVKNGEQCAVKSELQLAVDSEYLYMKYQENQPAGETGKESGFWSNCVELFFAELPILPLCQIGIGPDGTMHQMKITMENDVRRYQRCRLHSSFFNFNDGKTWSWLMAVPLKNLPLDKLKTGLTANFFRSRDKGGQSAAWSPLFFTEAYAEGLSCYGRIHFPEIIYGFTMFDASAVVTDPAALNGKSVFMDGNKGWTLRCKTGPIEKGEYYADLRIRTDASGDDTLTTRVGFYDETAKKIVYVKPVKVSEIAGKEFRTIRLGPMRLTPNVYFYIGGFNRKNVKPGKVYVDQLILRKKIPQEQAK